MEVAFAMAAFTLSASSFDISRPAFPGATAGRGSSVDIVCLVDWVEAVVDSELASEFSSPSAVKNNPFAALRS